MKKFKISLRYILFLIPLLVCTTKTHSQKEKGKMEILKNGEVIREAFSKGEIKAIMSLHHPDVIKALGYTNLLTGRNGV